MNQISEAAQAEIVSQLSDKSQFSPKEIRNRLQLLSASELINVTSAAAKGNFPAALAILSQVGSSEQTPSLEAVRQKLHKLERNKNLGASSKIKNMFSLIADLSSKDWLVIWPTLKPETIKSLYASATGKKSAEAGKEQATAILQHAKDTLMEKVIYQNQIVEVKIAHGPDNTVGIILDEKLTMVPASQCSALNEHVLGMTHMPSLARMLALAGVDTLPTTTETVREDKLPMGLRVVVEFDPDQPMDKTRVKLLNVDATTTLEGLRLRIKRLFKDLSADLASESPDYNFAVSNAQRLSNSLETMQAALQDLQVIRQRGGKRVANIPQVLEDEDY